MNRRRSIVTACLLLSWICTAGFAAELSELIPLTDLGTGKYQGFQGGLYDEGRNEPWGAHAEALKRMSARIVPLDQEGRPDPHGKIVIAGIGASVCAQLFDELERLAPETPGIRPGVEFINCALGGQDVNKLEDPSGRYWTQAAKTLAAKDLSTSQVQVIWYQSDELRDTRDDFPGRPQRVRDSFAKSLRLIKSHFPNARICYFSARHTTAFMPNKEGAAKHAEPRPYYCGWAIKWLIEEQAAGREDVRCEGIDAPAPLAAWATYFWTQGDKPREDGYRWTRGEASKDGVHLVPPARTRVAGELITFFLNDAQAKQWFAKSDPSPETKHGLASSMSTKKIRGSRAGALGTFKKDAGDNEPAWIINGQNKMPKLSRLVDGKTDGVKVIVRSVDGKPVREIPDVFKKHTDLNELLGAGQYRLEFLDQDGKAIDLTQVVGSVLRLR